MIEINVILLLSHEEVEEEECGLNEFGIISGNREME